MAIQPPALARATVVGLLLAPGSLIAQTPPPGCEAVELRTVKASAATLASKAFRRVQKLLKRASKNRSNSSKFNANQHQEYMGKLLQENTALFAEVPEYGYQCPVDAGCTLIPMSEKINSYHSNIKKLSRIEKKASRSLAKSGRASSNARSATSYRKLLKILAELPATIQSCEIHQPISSFVDPKRVIDWKGHVGVPGGIPQRTNLCATINSASATLVADINQAIQQCPDNQVVYLPAGTYNLTGSITFDRKSNVTLRGAGPGSTILVPTNNITTAINTGQNALSARKNIVSGSTKGSTAIVVEDVTGIQPGTLVDIFEANDPDFYWSRGGTYDRTGQLARVIQVDVATKTLHLEDPLMWDFTRSPGYRFYILPQLQYSGIEDLTIQAGSSYDGSMIMVWNAYAFWIKNVETAWGNGNEHIFLYGNLRTEVRDSYFHDTYSTTDGYGLTTVKGGGGEAGPWGRGGTTGLLVENNIFSGFWHSIILETESAGVIAYNFSRNARYPGWPDYQIADFNTNHGEHGMMVLFEGNVAAGIQNDGYHGSTSHHTYFRNWFSGQHVNTNRTGNIKTVDLCRYSYYHNVIGNVLGNPSWPRSTIGRYLMTGMPGYTEQAVIYRLGYPNLGNNGYTAGNPPSNGDAGGFDPKVEETLFRHGNYEYQNNQFEWNANAGSKNLPASLYLSAKPGWWGNLAWPAFGPRPDDPTTLLTGEIPAQKRFSGM